ncbi:MAG: hypothetical protein JEZ14_26035 [Marinilabiliaceae bacterium]|nr:hypothetical protein [Marinilabiliaceae bacterium]
MRKNIMTNLNYTMPGVVVIPDPFGEAAKRAVLNDKSVPADVNLIGREVRKRMEQLDEELPINNKKPKNK